MVQAILGKRSGNAIVPYSQTTKRTKEVDLTVTGTGWTTNRAVGVFYQDSNGVWRLTFNIQGSVSSSSRTTYTATITGVSFSTTSFPVTARSDSIGTTDGYTAGSADGRLIAEHPSTTTTFYSFSQDIELDSEPTTYTTSENLEAVVGADIYIEPATSTDKGIVNEGVSVSDAAGANPTKAEFDALLDSLRTAGVIAT